MLTNPPCSPSVNLEGYLKQLERLAGAMKFFHSDKAYANQLQSAVSHCCSQ